VRIKVEALEYHADLSPCGIDIGARRQKVDIVHDDGAAIRLLQTIAAAQQGALARTGWADQKDQLARLNQKIDALQDFGGAEALPDAACFEQIAGYRRCCCRTHEQVGFCSVAS
jgi:hypothetical protein